MYKGFPRIYSIMHLEVYCYLQVIYNYVKVEEMVTFWSSYLFSPSFIPVIIPLTKYPSTLVILNQLPTEYRFSVPCSKMKRARERRGRCGDPEIRLGTEP